MKSCFNMPFNIKCLITLFAKIELLTNTRRGCFITDEFHLMEDNLIMWKKKHTEAKCTFTSWRFFSFTPTNKYNSVALESAIEIWD